MVSVTVSGAEAVEARLRHASERVRPFLVEAVTKETLALQAHVIQDKLSGQVLHVRTGTLRRSITERVTETGETIQGIVGTNLPYGRIHEMGGVIHHPGGTPFYLDRGGQAHFVRLDSPLARNLPRTKPHPIAMPERSFLRSALADRAGLIRRSIVAALKAAFR